MTNDLTADPIPTPMERAVDAVRNLLAQNPDHVRVGELDPQEIARAALAETAEVYVSPERPIELRVAIEDEDGATVEQTFHLTRAQSINATKLGYALGGATRSVLQAYYGVTDDVAGYADAADAATRALGVR